MKLITDFSFDFDLANETYFNLLKEEDFDFKTKNIQLNVEKSIDSVKVNVCCDSVLDLKIAITALIKSLEIIDKTLRY